MGMNIRVLRRQRKKKDDNNDHDDSHIEIVYGEKGLEQIMKESDYVVIAAPLTAATNSMIGKAQLDLMKPTSIIINVGRGEIIDEDALINCLNERKILGAVLEVFSQEPLPNDSPFYQMDNVIVAAHCADNTADQLNYSLEILEDNLIHYCRDVEHGGDGRKDLINVVDRVEGY